jgi:hypothetical protein
MSEASIINLSSTTPAQPGDAAPVKWLADDNANPRNVSAYVEPANATQPGSISMAGDLYGSGVAPVVARIQTIPVSFDRPNQGDVLVFDDGGGDRGSETSLNWGSILGGVDARTTATETITTASRGMLVTLNNASSIAVTLDSTVSAKFLCAVDPIGVGVATLTPSSGLINGAANLALTGPGDLYFDGTDWWFKGGGSAGGSSPLTTKGDLYTYSSADARLAVGSNGKVLMADSSQTTGIKWATLAESDVTNLTTDLAAKLTNPMTTKGDIIVADTSGVPTRVAAGTTGYALISNGAGAAPSYQPVSTSAGAVQYGTRASLPGTPGVSGSCYVCSDSPFSMYVSDGTNWNGMFMGIPAADPALNAALVTKSTKTLTSSWTDTSLGGLIFGGASGGSDEVMGKVIPVTPSSTLKVRVNLVNGNSASGWCIWNDNTGKVVWIRCLGNQIIYSRYLVTGGTGWQANQSTYNSVLPIPFPSGNGTSTAAPQVGYMAFVFDGTNWAWKRYLDPACTVELAGNTIFTETLAGWIGTNFTHVGFGTSTTSTTTANVMWAIDLKIVHT